MIRSSKVQYFLGVGTWVRSWVLGHCGRHPQEEWLDKKKASLEISNTTFRGWWLMTWMVETGGAISPVCIFMVHCGSTLDWCLPKHNGLQHLMSVSYEKNVRVCPIEWHVQENTSKPSKKRYRTLAFLASWMFHPRFQGPRRRFGHHGSDGQDSRDESGNCVHAANFQNFQPCISQNICAVGSIRWKGADQQGNKIQFWTILFSSCDVCLRL